MSARGLVPPHKTRVQAPQRAAGRRGPTPHNGSPRTGGEGRTPTPNDVAEPCAGEPQARFAEAGAGNGASTTYGDGSSPPAGNRGTHGGRAFGSRRHRASARPYTRPAPGPPPAPAGLSHQAAFARQDALTRSYRDDFGKYAPRADKHCLDGVLGYDAIHAAFDPLEKAGWRVEYGESSHLAVCSGALAEQFVGQEAAGAIPAAGGVGRRDRREAIPPAATGGSHGWPASRPLGARKSSAAPGDGIPQALTAA